MSALATFGFCTSGAWAQEKPADKPLFPTPKQVVRSAGQAKAKSQPAAQPKAGSGALAPIIPKAPEGPKPMRIDPKAVLGGNKIVLVPAEGPVAARKPVEYNLGLKFATLGSITAPVPVSFQLGSGLKVHVLEDHQIPIVRASLLLRVGSVFDPPEKPGLAEDSLRAMLAGGTKAFPGSKFEDRIEAIGGTINLNVLPTRVELEFQCPSQYFDEVAGLLAEVVTNPTFDPDAVDESQGQVRTGIGTRNRDVRQIVSREFRLRVHGEGTPLFRRMEYEHLDNIGREDLVNFHRRNISPASSFLLIAGDVAPGAARSRIETLFAGWKTAGPAAPFPAIEPKPVAGVYYIERRESRKSTFMLGQTGGKVHDADYPALLILAAMLGGEAGSRIYERSHAKPEWRLEAAASWDGDYIYPGMFQIEGTVEPPYTTEALSFFLSEIERLQTTPVDDTELQEAKTRVITTLSRRWSRFGTPFVPRMLDEFYGMPAGDWLATLQTGLNSVTRTSLLNAAKARFKTDQLVIVVSGSETLFDKPLSSLNRKVVPLDIRIPGPRPFQPSTDAASLERGKQWIGKLQTALGGADALSKIVDLQMRGHGTAIAGNPIEITTLERWMEGPIWRQDLKIKTSITALFYDGNIAWSMVNGKLYVVSDPILAQMRSELFRQLFKLALSDRDPKRKVCHLGSNVLQITTESGEGVRIYLDESSGLPERMIYQSVEGDGVNMIAEDQFENWITSGGIKFPARVATKRNGRKFSDITFEEVKVNSGLNREELRDRKTK